MSINSEIAFLWLSTNLRTIRDIRVSTNAKKKTSTLLSLFSPKKYQSVISQLQFDPLKKKKKISLLHKVLSKLGQTNAHLRPVPPLKFFFIHLEKSGEKLTKLGLSFETNFQSAIRYICRWGLATSLLPPISSPLPDIFAHDRSTNFHPTSSSPLLVKQRHRLLRGEDRSPLIDWTNVRFRNFHINGNADSTCCKMRPWWNSWPIVIVRFYSRPVGRPPGACSSIGARVHSWKSIVHARIAWPRNF